MSLRKIQSSIEELYHIDTEADIHDFLVDEEGLKELGQDAKEMASRGEVLLILEGGEELSVGLYLDRSLRETLDDGAPSPRYFATVEGVSHFVYLLSRAAQDRPVRKLELELQAEVDKFAAGVLGIAPPTKTEPRELRRRLYEDYALHPDLEEEEEERYKEAARLAREYSLFLERRFLREQRTWKFIEELRGFYRLELTDKIAHILSR